ncbi:MAG: MucR family transcriptional regulator [Syntrophobacteraceae bacterium]|jgi:predicted transcriptional regulator
MAKKIIEIASEIVQTQVSLASMSAAEITSSLRQVFGTLLELQKAESGEIELPQAQESAAAQEKTPGPMTPENSIQNDKVVCLECGAEMKQLTQKHLTSHDISPREYKKKYGFPMRTPLAAKSLTKARSKAAKKRGLPANLLKAIEARRQSKAQGAAPSPQPKGEPAVKRRRKPKSE